MLSFTHHPLVEDLSWMRALAIFDVTGSLEQHRQYFYQGLDTTAPIPPSLARERTAISRSDSDGKREAPNRMRLRSEGISWNHFVVDISQHTTVGVDEIGRTVDKNRNWLADLFNSSSK